jgi:hypothetical protein
MSDLFDNLPLQVLDEIAALDFEIETFPGPPRLVPLDADSWERRLWAAIVRFLSPDLEPKPKGDTRRETDETEPD